MPTTQALPDSPRPPESIEADPLGPSENRATTPRPTRRAEKRLLQSKIRSIPSCLRQGVVSGLLRVFPRQIHGSPFFSRLHRLAVYYRNAWFRFSARRETNLPTEPIMKPVERSVESPSAIARVHRGVVRKVSRQVAPLASGAHQIKSTR